MIRELIKIKVIVSIIIAGIIISGCIGEQKSTTPIKSTTELPSETPTASPINQKSNVKISQLIPNPDDVPRFTLKNYDFISVPQNSYFVINNDFVINNHTETTRYKDVLPFGYRNVGQTSSWSNKEGTIEGASIPGTIDVIISKFDSKSGIKEFLAEQYYGTCESKRNSTIEEPLKSPGCGSANIGDYSWYTSGDSYEKNPNISLTWIKFSYGNYLVEVITMDEIGKSLNETIQFAKVIRMKLD